MTDLELQQLVARARGVKEATWCTAFRVGDINIVASAINEILENFEPRPGACVMMSAMLEALLRDRHGMPAVCVAGDLNILGKWVFRGNERLPAFDTRPTPGRPRRVTELNWKGHCWVEVGGLIVEVSLLRTSRVLLPHSTLRQFVDANFGPRRAAFATPIDDLPPGLRYRRQFVLTDNQVNGFVSGEIYRIEHQNKASAEGLG